MRMFFSTQFYVETKFSKNKNNTDTGGLSAQFRIRLNEISCNKLRTILPLKKSPFIF
jgi:hypothetical protein